MPTWRLSLLLVWAPGVRAGLQQRRQQQQRRLLPLIAVSWRQATVRKLPQPFNEGWRSGMKRLTDERWHRTTPPTPAHT